MVKRLTIKALKEFIKDLPDDMEVITDRHSDYCLLENDQMFLVKAVPDKNPLIDWVMTPHPTMSQERKDREKTYLGIGV